MWKNMLSESGLGGKFDAATASTWLDGVKDFQSYLAAVQNALPPKDTDLRNFLHPYPNSWCPTGSSKSSMARNED
jgi:hypothetical protein